VGISFLWFTDQILGSLGIPYELAHHISSIWPIQVVRHLWFTKENLARFTTVLGHTVRKAG
jgi:hypothetical protein